MSFGQPFKARPNFYWFQACGRPCWLPIYAQPAIPEEKGHALTEGWPCEAYFDHDRSSGEACFDAKRSLEDRRDGDWLEVVGQVWGQELRNEKGEVSTIWNVVRIPAGKLRNGGHANVLRDNDGTVLGYASDLWMGNSGLHAIPWPRR